MLEDIEYIKQQLVSKIGDEFGFNKRISEDVVNIMERNSFLCHSTDIAFDSIFECHDIEFINQLINRITSDNTLRQQNNSMHQDKWRKGLVAYSHLLESLQYPDITELLTEGAQQDVHASRYERNAKARKKCIAHYGTKCYICGFDFEKVYGEIGKGFIEVHHVKPVSEIGQEYQVDPINDLRPLCSNCHSMIHRTTPVGNVEEMRSKFLQANNI